MKKLYKIILITTLMLITVWGNGYSQGDVELGYNGRQDTLFIIATTSTANKVIWQDDDVFTTPGTNGKFNSATYSGAINSNILYAPYFGGTAHYSTANYTDESYHEVTYSNDEGYSYTFGLFYVDASLLGHGKDYEYYINRWIKDDITFCAGDAEFLYGDWFKSEGFKYYPYNGQITVMNPDNTSFNVITANEDSNGFRYGAYSGVQEQAAIRGVYIRDSFDKTQLLIYHPSEFYSNYSTINKISSGSQETATVDDDTYGCSYSSTGVVNVDRNDGYWLPNGTIDDITHEFNPNSLSVGDHVFTYYFDNSNGACGNSVSTTIKIVDETPNAGDDSEFCIYAGGVEKTSVDLSTELSNQVANGGTWSSADGNGVVNDAISGTILDLNFIPNGTSSYNLRYTIDFGNGTCTWSDDVTLDFVNLNNSVITVVDAADDYSCSESTIDLEINAFTGFTFEWYDAAVGGNLLATGLSLTTPSITTTTNYYVEGTNTATGCKTQRLIVVATISSNPYGTNTFFTLAPDQSCGSSASLNLNASTARADYLFYWYDAEVGGNQLFVGTSFSPGLLTETTEFWVAAEYTPKGCISPRKSVTASINADPVVNGGEDVILCDSNTPYDLFDGTVSPVGGEYSGAGIVSGEFFDPFGLTPANYTIIYTYIDPISSCQATDLRVITINDPVVISITPSQEHCLFVSGTKETAYDLTLFAPSPSGGDWSTSDASVSVDVNTLDLTGVNSPGGISGSKVVTLTYTYTDANTCAYSKDVQLVINSHSDTEVNASGDDICGAGEVTLIAENISGNGLVTIGWFEDQTGGTSIETGGSLTRTIPTTTSYWVALRSNGCYGERKEVIATVNEVEIAEAGIGVFLCLVTDTYDLDIGATTYDGGTGVWTGDGVVGGTSTFDADLVGLGSHIVTYTWYGQNGCESTDTRIVNVGAENAIIGRSELQFSLYNDGTRVNTYDLDGLTPSPIGGVFSVTYEDAGRGSFFIDESTNELSFLGIDESALMQTLTVTYSVGDGNGCDSETTSKIFVHTLSNADFVTTGNVTCGQGALALNATSTLVSANVDTHELTWFSSENSDDAIVGVGSTYTTPSLTSTNTYYVAAKNKDTNSYGPRVEVIATINPLPEITGASDLFLCDVNANKIDLSVGIFPKGGVFTGSDAIETDGKTFAPLISGEGAFEITYTFVDSETLCESSAVFNVQVGLLSETAGAGVDINVCFGHGNFTLNPEKEGGSWSSDNSLIKSRINNTTSIINLTGVAPGQYSLSYERLNAGGCLLEDVITLGIASPPNAPTVQDIFICGSGIGNISASSNETDVEILWYANIDSSTPIFRGEQYETPSLSGTTNYYVSVLNNSGCESEKVEVRANVANIPQVDAGVDLNFCADNVNYILTQDVSVLGGTFDGIGVDGDIFKGGNGPGVYEISYNFTDAVTGCSASDTRTITVGIVPEISMDVDVIEIGDPVRFSTNLNNIVSINWDFGNGITSDDKSPYQYFYVSGKYTIRLDLVLDNGCTGSYVFEDFIDVQGNEFDIITGEIDFTESVDVTVYPNPISSRAIYGVVPSSFGNEIVVELYTIQGAKLYANVVAVQGGEVLLVDEKSVGSLETGKYILRLKSEQGLIITKSIIKN